MPNLVTTIKNAIKVKLDLLVTQDVLQEVQEDDFKVSPVYSRDFPQYPAAVLTCPSIEADTLTNRDNIRTHVFDIVVIEKGENITSVTQIEDLMENILNAFDNDPTLGGAANGGVEPAVSTPAPISSKDGSFVIFVVTLKAKATKDLTF